MKKYDVLIFRTSITGERDRMKVEALFVQFPQIYHWNVDLEDWEKVLRIESEGITAVDVKDALLTIGIYNIPLFFKSLKQYDNQLNVNL